MIARLRRYLQGRPLSDPSVRPPFFIIGSGRSGNTLLRSILTVHPEVHIPPETYVLGPIVWEWRLWSRLPWPQTLKLVLAELQFHPEFPRTFNLDLGGVYRDLRAEARSRRTLAHVLDRVYQAHAEHVGSPAVRWGDKTPLNTFHLERLDAVFPRARYIHMLRDGRDVVSSYRDMPGHDWTIPAAADRWQRAVREAREFAASHPDQVLTVRYEKLVRQPFSVLSDVCAHLNLDVRDAMLSPHRADRTLGDVEALPHHYGLDRPIHDDSVGRWRDALSAAEKAEIHARIGEDLAAFGY